MNTKYIYKYLLIFIAFITFSGCSDFLDNAPDDELTLEMVFNDKTRTEDWLANIYHGIPDPYWGHVRDIGYNTVGDDMSPSQRWLEYWGGTLLNFRVGNFYTNSDWNAGFWNNLPKKIRSAYILIDNAHPNPLQGVTEDDIEDMKNQSRFLIAYYYWTMTEAYGAVPFFDGIVDVNSPSSELMKGQMAFDDMVNWIDQELIKLSKALPAKRGEAYFGQATSIMCLSVRARMLLFAASPLVNGNSMYKGIVNHDEKNRFNPTYDPAKWKRAVDAYKELIDAAHAEGHGLYIEKNADGTIDPFMSCYNVHLKKTSEGNKEILFARPSSNYSEYERHITPRGCGGNGGLGATQEFVDAFFMSNGLSPILGYNGDGSPIINTASGYTEKGFSTAPEIRNTKWDPCRNAPDAKPGQITMDKTFNMYSNREPRFYLSILFNGAWFHQERRTTRMMNGEWDGGPTHDAPQHGYLFRKKTSLESIPRDGKFPYRPGILIRMAEVYLSYAEALNEVATGGSEEAIAYLNMIRERAGIPAYGIGKDANGFDRIPYTKSQDYIRDLIHKERRIELSGEGIRYHDLRRWMLAEKLLDGDEYGMNFGGNAYTDDKSNSNAFFVRTVDLKRVFTKKQYWFPVHQSEIDKDPTLVQAPFWNE